MTKTIGGVTFRLTPSSDRTYGDEAGSLEYFWESDDGQRARLTDDEATRYGLTPYSGLLVNEV